MNPSHQRQLCLSGWAQPHDALATLFPEALHLDYAPAGSVDRVMRQIKESSPTVELAVGWSLGGWLLMKAVAEGWLQCGRLVIFGAPVQFVRDAVFPHGMGEQTFQQFKANFTHSPERTAKRFSHLVAKGDANYDQVIEQLEQVEPPNLMQWAWGLDVLEVQKASHIAYEKLPDTLLIYGKQDAIVSPLQGSWLHQCHPLSSLHLLDDCAHAPHLHNLEWMSQHIEGWLASTR